jgi:thioesterase domain-containing protein
MIPGSFVTLAELPLTANGKVNRRALPAPEMMREMERGYLAPRDLLELNLTHIWEDVLNIRPIGIRDNFFELGGHSLLAVHLMSRVQKVLQQKLPLTSLFQGPTIEYQASIVRKHEGHVSSDLSLVPIQPHGPRTPFFCVHAIGGNVLSYVELARHLGTEQPFYGLQSRGLTGQQMPHTRIEDMASDYLEEIRLLQPAGPYLLGGWSMGGIVAFEMTRQLRAQGQEVAMLALIDTTAHTGARIPSEHDNLTLVARFAADMGLPLSRLDLAIEQLSQLEPDEQLGHVLSHAKVTGLVPEEIGLSEIESLFNVFKANLKAVRSYQMRFDSCPIMLLKASESEDESSQDLTKGWKAFAGGGLEIQTVPGDHYTILREPNVSILARYLEKCLDKAQELLVGAPIMRAPKPLARSPVASVIISGK